MSVYKSNSGPNWGAGLHALSSGLLGIYERQQREAEAARQREQEQADRLALQARQDELLARNDPYMAVPPKLIPYTGLPSGVEALQGQSIGVTPAAPIDLTVRRPSSVIGDWAGIYDKLNPETNTNTSDYYMKVGDGYVGFTGSPWAAAGEGRRVNVVGTNNGLPVVELGNWTAPAKAGEDTTPVRYVKTDNSEQLVDMKDSQLNAAIQSGRVTFGPPDPTGVVTLIERPDDSSVGKSGGTQKQVEARANALTTAALGEKQQKLGRDGVFIDTSAGGTLVGGQDFSNLVSPEYRRAFYQAATDSSNTGRWPINSPMEPLIAAIGKDTASQYIDMALPAGAQFNPGRPNDPTDDEFTVPGGGRKGIPDSAPGWVPSRSNDRHMKTIDFFKEYIIPTINEAKDAGIGWQGLVKAAKTYGVNIDQLKGLLDQKKFAAYLATAAATPAAPKSVPRPKGF